MSRSRKPRARNPVVPDPKSETITISRAAFQALHGAARSVFREAIKIDNHSAEALIFLQALDLAIEEGHTSLGTQRPYADHYIHMVKGVTEAQMQNARRILENEGLLQKSEE